MNKRKSLIVFRQVRFLSIVLYTLLILFPQTRLHSQQLPFKKYTQTSGLASNYIFDLYQDENGFIWAATDRGVSRYDGHSFQTYSMNDGLGENLVYDIFQDQEGAMWFGTYEGGVTRFDGQNFRTITEKDGLLGNDVHGITQDNFGRMYFHTSKGLSVLTDTTFISIKNTSGMWGEILRHSSGKIFFSIDSDIYRLDPSDDHQLHYRQININPMPGIEIRGSTWASPYEMKSKDILFPIRQGFLKLFLNDETRSIKSEYYAGEPFALLEDRYGQVWRALRNGVEVQTKNGIMNLSAEQGLEPSYVEAILEDLEGTVWLGTFGGGIYKIVGDHLTVYNELGSKVINAVFEDSRQLVWIGTSEGVSLMSGHGTKIKNLLPSSHFEVQAFGEDRNGNIFIGTYQGILDPILSGVVKSDRLHYKSQIYEGVSSIYIDNNNDLWAGTYGGGVYRFNKSGSEIFTASNDLVSNMVEDIVGSPNSIWFLSRGHGATHYDYNSFEIYSRKNGLPSDNIYSLLEENDTVWFGTDQGLSLMHQKNIQTFNLKNGLNGRYIQKIFRTNENELYVLTDKALNKFQNGQFQVFGSSPILPIPEASITDAHFSQDENILWLATTAGLAKIDLSRVIERQKWQSNVKLKVAITDVYSDSIQLLHYNVGFHDSNQSVPELDYSRNNLRIRFAGLSFIDETSIRYRFKLQGADDNLSEPVNENEVIYPNLRSGFYKFFVYAIGPDGNQTEKPAQFSFRILPPFWETTWFRVIYGTIFLILFILLTKYLSTRSLKKQIRELEVQKKIQDERVRISGELHDSIGANLTSIITGLEISKRYSQKDEKEKLADNINSLEDHTRSTIDELRQTIWSLNTEVKQVEQLNEKIREYIRHALKLSDKPDIQFNFKGDKNLRLSSSQALNLFRIIQESIHNALKYSNSTKILVNAKTENKILRITINDTGAGFDLKNIETYSTGFGLSNMKKRAETINAKLHIDTAVNKGTTIIIEINTMD